MNTAFALAAALLLATAPVAASEVQPNFEINGLPPEVALHLNDIPALPRVQASFAINGLPPQAALHLNDLPPGPGPLVQTAFEIDGMPPQLALHLNDGPMLLADDNTQPATPAAIWELEKQHGIVQSSLEDVVKAGK